jgi:hypothetical protein
VQHWITRKFSQCLFAQFESSGKLPLIKRIECFVEHPERFGLLIIRFRSLSIRQHDGNIVDDHGLRVVKDRRSGGHEMRIVECRPKPPRAGNASPRPTRHAPGKGDVP